MRSNPEILFGVVSVDIGSCIRNEQREVSFYKQTSHYIILIVIMCYLYVYLWHFVLLVRWIESYVCYMLQRLKYLEKSCGERKLCFFLHCKLAVSS